MLLERFRQPIATQSNLSTVCRRRNPITGLRRTFTTPHGVPGSPARSAGRVLLAAFAGLLFSAGHAAAQASPTWMADLKPRIGHLQLNQLAIPGTHDTGTYSLTHDPSAPVSDDFFLASFQQQADSAINSFDPTGILTSTFNDALGSLIDPLILNWGMAQDEDILDQLNAGIRYFDIRPCPFPFPSSNPLLVTDIKVCHSLFGASVTDVLASVKAFSLAHPDEIIIMDFNHITSHQITGTISQDFAASIIRSFSNQTSGDMLIPFGPLAAKTKSNSAATATLGDVWAQPARIVALYDDPDLPLMVSGGLLWPGQGVSAGSAIGGSTADMIDSPWPGVNNVKDQLSHDQGYMSCRCDDPQNPSTSTPNTLFVLQTNPTPDIALIGGSLINQIESNTSISFGDLGSVCVLCPVLDPLASALNLASNPPSGLADLAYQANAAILSLPTQAILASPNGSLRQNLNIVQADRFEHMYDSSRNVVLSNFANSMVQLDTPPQSTLSIGGPQYSASQQLFVTSATPFTIGAMDTYFGVLNESYEYKSSRFDSKLQQSQGSGANFTLAAPAPDGQYTVTSYATNIAGLPEGPNTKGVTLDNTAPVITVTQPASVAYPHSSTLTLNYGVTDGSGSGVKSVTPATLDGGGTAGGQTLASGQAINLLTQLPLGAHTFIFGGAADNLGNASPATTVTFTVIATADSIKADVTQFVASGAISNSAWASSLSDKLNQAAALRSAGDCSDAASVYNAFINELSAQSGKKVTATAAGIMTNDAQYMIAHCP